MNNDLIRLQNVILLRISIIIPLICLAIQLFSKTRTLKTVMFYSYYGTRLFKMAEELKRVNGSHINILK